jgi:hypothetical protein
MVAGGRKPGSGRPLGSKNMTTREIAKRVSEEGITPLEIMVNIAREFYAEGMALRNLAIAERDIQKLDKSYNILAMALEASNKAAPYMHARFSSIELSNKDGIPLEVTRIERVIIDPVISAVDVTSAKEATEDDECGNQSLN